MRYQSTGSRFYYKNLATRNYLKYEKKNSVNHVQQVTYYVLFNKLKYTKYLKNYVKTLYSMYDYN